MATIYLSALARASFAFIALTASLATSTGACAQAAGAAYPDKSIRLVVPFTAGGALDVTGRIVGQKLTDSWGKQVVIDNRVGAGGNIGAEFVAKSAPDGYTLLMSSVTTQAINMSLTAKPPYDFVRDYSAVGLVASAPLALGDLLSGQVQFAFSTIGLVEPHVGTGRLRILGVGSRKRYTRLPDIPTIAESGVNGYEAEQWYGVVAPAGTPPAIVNKLAAELKTIVANPEVRERFYSQGIEPAYATPEEFAAYIKAIVAKYAKLLGELGLKAE